MKLTDLPEILQELIELIGMGETILIIQEFGGEPLYIPRDPQTCTQLKRAGLSQDTIDLLCERFQTETIEYIPKYGKVILAIRNEEIRNLHETGATVISIAKQFGLVRRRIHQILAEDTQTLPDGCEQITLF